MKFTFELYRAKSKQKGETPQNKLIITSNDTLHFNSKGQKVKKLRELSCKAVQDRFGSLKKAKFNSKKQCGVTLTVFYPTNRRSDPDNLQPTLKALLDGFTDSGLLTDDNHQVVIYTKYCYGGLSGTTGYKLEVEFDKVNSWIILVKML